MRADVSRDHATAERIASRHDFCMSPAFAGAASVRPGLVEGEFNEMTN